VKTGDNNQPPKTGRLMFYDFRMAYKIMRVEPRSNSDGTVFINKVVEEYHDPKFPVSEKGAVDYGPDLLGFTESSP
jgi:hypothetical protein